MAQLRIDNITATGAWQALDIPRRTIGISIQNRDSVVTNYRYRDQTTYWSIKADTSRTVTGNFVDDEIYVQAASGTIEVEYNTMGVSL